MKNEALFYKTIDILVKAYQNETLGHGDTCGCAVGNIIAGNLGYKVTKQLNWVDENGDEKFGEWSEIFCTTSMGNQLIDASEYIGEAKEQVDSSGYKWLDLAKIEKSFESVRSKREKDKDGYLGLMSVCDTLMLIHECTAEETESAKLQFVKV